VSSAEYEKNRGGKKWIRVSSLENTFANSKRQNLKKKYSIANIPAVLFILKNLPN